MHVHIFMTGESNGLFEKKASKFPFTCSHIAANVSGVWTALCGDNTTLSMVISSLGTWGSFSNTSNPAPASSRCTKHCTNSFSSIIGPRPILMMTPSFPNANMTSLLIMWRVCSVKPQHIIRTSLSAASSRTLE